MNEQDPKIAVKKETKLIVDGARVYRRETYDDIINRVFKEHQENKK